MQTIIENVATPFGKIKNRLPGLSTFVLHHQLVGDNCQNLPDKCSQNNGLSPLPLLKLNQRIWSLIGENLEIGEGREEDGE